MSDVFVHRHVWASEFQSSLLSAGLQKRAVTQSCNAGERPLHLMSNVRVGGQILLETGRLPCTQILNEAQPHTRISTRQSGTHDSFAIFSKVPDVIVRPTVGSPDELLTPISADRLKNTALPTMLVTILASGLLSGSPTACFRKW